MTSHFTDNTDRMLVAEKDGLIWIVDLANKAKKVACNLRQLSLTEGHLGMA